MFNKIRKLQSLMPPQENCVTVEQILKGHLSEPEFSQLKNYTRLNSDMMLQVGITYDVVLIILGFRRFNRVEDLEIPRNMVKQISVACNVKLCNTRSTQKSRMISPTADEELDRSYSNLIDRTIDQLNVSEIHLQRQDSTTNYKQSGLHDTDQDPDKTVHYDPNESVRTEHLHEMSNSVIETERSNAGSIWPYGQNKPTSNNSYVMRTGQSKSEARDANKDLSTKNSKSSTMDKEKEKNYVNDNHIPELNLERISRKQMIYHNRNIQNSNVQYCDDCRCNFI